MPKRVLNPSAAATGLVLLAGPTTPYSAYNVSQLARSISKKRQKKEFYDMVNRAGENVKDYINKKKPLIDSVLDIKVNNSERTKKAGRKGAILGASIPIGLAAYAYAKQLHKYKKHEKEMEKYRKDYYNWKKQRDLENLNL
jgi:hypothetical protein